MAQLVEMTGVPKSTILYYIKEGLLPQPEKIKQNVCLYDPEYVERIKFLKFLQNNYGKSIAELKAAVCADGRLRPERMRCPANITLVVDGSVICVIAAHGWW